MAAYTWTNHFHWIYSKNDFKSVRFVFTLSDVCQIQSSISSITASHICEIETRSRMALYQNVNCELKWDENGIFHSIDVSIERNFCFFFFTEITLSNWRRMALFLQFIRTECTALSIDRFLWGSPCPKIDHKLRAPLQSLHSSVRLASTEKLKWMRDSMRECDAMKFKPATEAHKIIFNLALAFRFRVGLSFLLICYAMRAHLCVCASVRCSIRSLLVAYSLLYYLFINVSRACVCVWVWFHCACAPRLCVFVLQHSASELRLTRLVLFLFSFFSSKNARRCAYAES